MSSANDILAVFQPELDLSSLNNIECLIKINSMNSQLIRCTHCGQLNRIDADKVDRGFQPKCGTCKEPIEYQQPVIVTDSTFSRVVEASDVPVLVDFWAHWCGPCHMLAPVIEQLAKEFAGKIKVAKLNTDENPHVSSRFQIRSIPALIVFENGREVDRIIGVQPKQQIAARIQRVLGQT